MDETTMAVYIVGDYIREIRIRKGYTQEEVSYGICTPASLSRIENGAQMPGKHTLDKLMERLGMENHIFNMFVSREEMDLYETIQTLVRNITDQKTDELRTQICKMEELTKNSSELERQCLYFAKGELIRQTGGDKQEVMELLMKAIHVTLPDFDGVTPLESNLLTFDEITIVNAIAIQHAGEGRFDNALKLNFWLRKYMAERLLDGALKTAKYPMILFNLSNWLAEKQRFHEALEISEEGVEFCTQYGNLVMLPRLVFNKACANAELRKRDEAKTYFNQSIVIFETMKQFDKAKMATDWCRNKYEIEF